MKFLIDAQLPSSLAEFLRRRGVDSIHTLDLPKSNKTSDAEICAIAKDENCIVVTKDSDFIESYLLTATPSKILIVNTGNIKNSKLLQLFEIALDEILTSLKESNYVEIMEDKIVVH